MKLSEAKEALRQCRAANRPAFLLGPPGVGKSAIAMQLADELFAEKYGFQVEGTKLRDKKTGRYANKRPYFRDERMLQRDPVEVAGLFRIDGDTTTRTRPDFLPVDGEGIIILDELPNAPMLTQVACYQLLHDGCIGQHTLLDTWWVLAAGNRGVDRTGINKMPNALRNRFAWINIEVDAAEWVEWGLANGIATEVLAFIRFRPELLFTFDPKKNDNAFATPRTWEYLSDVLKAGNGEISVELAKGIVGEGPATEFIAFLKIFRSLPDPDVILMDPSGAKVPEDPATLYAICGALSNKASEQNFGRVVEYANRLPDEFSVLLVRDAVKRDNQLSLTRAFVEWTSKHNDVLI